MAVGAVTVGKGYGRFAAAVNSLLALLFLVMPLLVIPSYAQSPPIRLAVLGDSLAAGFGLRSGQSFPAGLERALKAAGRDVVVSNQGVSGDTSAGGLDRVDWLLGDKPDIVMLELGANDALRGIDPASTEKNLGAIIEKLQARHVTVWLLGMLAPRNFGAEYDANFDGLYKRLADRYGLPLYPFLLDGVAQDAALNQADGLHPSEKGVAIIVERLLPFVNRNLDDYAASVHRAAHP